jgi:uncharacterized protein YecT (DUF1311 family)
MTRYSTPPVLLLPLLLALAPIAAASVPALEGASTVAFEQTSDPHVVRLGDGRALTVIYAEGDWEKTEDWAEGRSLILGFDPERGTVLADPRSGFVVPVVDDLGDQHPIDVANDACQDDDSSTLGISRCLAEAAARWDRQLNINYQRLINVLDAEKQAPVKAAQRAWLAWRDAQFAAISATYQREGTMWGLVSAGHRLDLVREQAVRLGQLAAD